MKKKFLMQLLLLIPLGISAQTVRFTYDNAGNRVSSKVFTITLSQTKLNAARDSLSEQEMTSSLASCHVTVYPNPTKGEVNLKVGGIDEQAESQVDVYNQNGEFLKTITGKGNTTIPVDLTPYVNGIYLLNFHQGESVQLYKIIKY